MSLSISIGNWLYRNCFPLYNVAYRRFKKSKDRHELELIRERVRPGDGILDIGSNIGFYAEVFSSLVGPEGKVYCFEPDRINYGHLVRNTAGCGNTTLFNLAVSDREGTLKIYRSKVLNVDHRTYPVDEFETVEEIRATSIDALIRKGAIGRVAFVKIDIQGFELKAFEGMKDLLGGDRPLSLLSEFWPYGLKQAGASPTELHDFFDARRYRFRLLEGGALREIGREFFAESAAQPFEIYYNVLVERRP
jgi:FkbM family methyltransferase